MFTTKFLCKDPDNDDGRKYFVQCFADQPVMVDERILKAYPQTFTIIEKAEPITLEERFSDEQIRVWGEEKDDSDSEANDTESLDTAALSPEITEVEAANAKETADEVDTEILEDVIAEAEGLPDIDNELLDAENTEPDITEDIEAEEKAYAEAELMATIKSFRSRKKLNIWATGIGIELDGQLKLKEMKVDAKRALNLG
jgi:hypothetical protein